MQTHTHWLFLLLSGASHTRLKKPRPQLDLLLTLADSSLSLPVTRWKSSIIHLRDNISDTSCKNEIFLLANDLFSFTFLQTIPMLDLNFQSAFHTFINLLWKHYFLLHEKKSFFPISAVKKSFFPPCWNQSESQWYLQYCASISLHATPLESKINVFS